MGCSGWSEDYDCGPPACFIAAMDSVFDVSSVWEEAPGLASVTTLAKDADEGA